VELVEMGQLMPVAVVLVLVQATASMALFARVRGSACQRRGQEVLSQEEEQ
jgi:hypothetical protein